METLKAIGLLGGGLAVIGALTYLGIKLIQLMERLASAETKARVYSEANVLMSAAFEKQMVALERNRKYARLLENNVIENAGPAELANILSELYKQQPAGTGNNDPE